MRRPPWPLLVSGWVTMITALVLFALAGLVFTTRHGTFSLGIGAVLGVYGLLVGWVGWAFLRARRWARGPVVAVSLIHLFSVVSAASTAHPALVAAAVVALGGAIVCAVLPVTTASLGAAR